MTFAHYFQAFAAAQLNGDWSQLTTEMAAVLGPEAVGLSAGPQDVLAQASQIIQNLVTGPGAAPDAVPGEKSGYYSCRWRCWYRMMACCMFHNSN